jgi:hypothetical protein
VSLAAIPGKRTTPALDMDAAQIEVAAYWVVLAPAAPAAMTEPLLATDNRVTIALQPMSTSTVIELGWQQERLLGQTMQSSPITNEAVTTMVV